MSGEWRNGGGGGGGGKTRLGRSIVYHWSMNDHTKTFLENYAVIRMVWFGVFWRTCS